MSRTYISRDHLRNNEKNRKTFSIHPLVEYLDSYIHHDTVTKCDLKSKITQIYDQGQIGSCTANAVCQSMRMCPKYANFFPSRLYVYAKERITEGQKTLEDTGADAEDGLVQIRDHGVCTETSWPYNPDNANVIPPASCDQEASNYKVHSIGRICSDYATRQSKINSIKKSIIAGIPILIGIEVYESFESQDVANTGVVPMPDPKEQCVGGHEILLVGFDDETQRFCFVNSWGPDWGDHGYGYLTYDFVTSPNYTTEFIMITSA